MATLTFLLSFLARKANNIVQALFGWCITSLFGKLPRRAQTMVTGALILSIAWPIFVVGLFWPHVASWAIAFVPLHRWVGPNTMRIVWAVIALFSPLVVGTLVFEASPHHGRRASRAALHGYPIALGFFAAFVVVLVTVPLVKLASIVRGWSDEHIYVQPHEAAYDRVFRELGEACARAGLLPEISDAPLHMVLATTIMQRVARGAVSSLAMPALRRITADRVQLYLYPADLLVRGNPKRIARIRAMLSRTSLDADAYLVASEPAQRIQDELSRLHAVTQRAWHGPLPRMLATRLREVFREMIRADIPFDEWIALEVIARRLERRMIVAGLADPFIPPLDAEPDRLRDVAERANQIT